MAKHFRKQRAGRAKKFGAILSVVVFAALPVVVATQASALSGSIPIEGKGWGHGRGMSQYGSLGYALAGRDHNWILNHYYSNTTNGVFNDNNVIGVSIEASLGKDAIFTARNAYSVAGIGVAANRATLVRRVGANNFQIFQSGSCGGAGGWQHIDTRSGDIVVSPPSLSPGDNRDLMLDYCDGNARTYRGSFSVIDDAGKARVINNVPLWGYLRGVVPRESPASWANLGGGAGAHALRAQSVAARSYAVSSPRPRWTTCDTTSCQVYGGAFLNGTYIEDSRTNAAISATTHQIRVLNGVAARTEFSSSSGGWTAGGTFPAVIDEGDNTSHNPNRNWSTSIPVATIQASYPAIGSLNNIVVNSRNGLGEWNGRVTSMTLSGSNGNVTVTGAQFRAALGLKSDWFRLAGTPSGGIDGYWLGSSDGGVFSLGSIPFHGSAGALTLQRPIVGGARASDNGGYWLVASDGGVFSYGSAKFHGSAGAIRLNKPVVGMASTPDGGGYWLVASDGGIFSYGNAGFYGSTGAMTLNKPVVGMAATPTGKGYWLVASDGGIFSFGDAKFHGSAGAIRLAAPISAMASTPDGSGYWMVATDGGVFTYGNAPYFGSMPGSGVRGQQAVSLMPSKTGNGYAIATINGNVYNYGDAPWMGGIAGSFRGSVVTIMGHHQP